MSVNTGDSEFDDELGQLIKKSLSGYKIDIDERQRHQMGESIINEVISSKRGRGHEFDDLLEAAEAENQADASIQFDI